MWRSPRRGLGIDRWVGYAFAGGCLDKTGVGEGPYEAINQFMREMEGITLTAQVKEDLMDKLKLVLRHGSLTIPRATHNY